MRRRRNSTLNWPAIGAYAFVLGCVGLAIFIAASVTWRR